MVKPVRKSSSKNPPILSHEFIIQNHADIVSCVAMVFIIGLMMQATSPIASIFIALQHNVTESGERPMYLSGAKDWAAIFFYSLICIVAHAIIQEYVLDKVSKKLHLSKSKLAIFNTSGQLTIFYAVSAIWGLEVIVLREHYIPDVNLLWADYPPPMPFMMKLFFIIQLAYCLHEIPELYFQRVKKEEYVNKITNSLAALVLIAVPYFLNFNRLLICLLVLHYISECIHHICQLVQTIDKDEKFVKITGLVSTVLLILARLGSVVLAVVTLWFGLSAGEQHQLDIQAGYFNIAAIRLAVLAGILILQLYHTFNFISQIVAKLRESKATATSTRAKPQKKEKFKKSKRSGAEESDLPEVDQNTNKNLKNRAQKVK
ncbi:hypothetical protein FQR65_LT04855 [Abscondita terminalis]|nr:hypothetical protein FQR65_LT04855 [Abscondita terminalis]